MSLLKRLFSDAEEASVDVEEASVYVKEASVEVFISNRMSFTT